MVESELIANARSGQHAAFTALVGAYQVSVYNLCRRMLGDAIEAEDAAQETFLRVYSQLHRYDPGRPFKTWLFAIASHYCIDRLRRQRRPWLSLDEELSGEEMSWRSVTPGPEESALRRERQDEVAACLALLPPRDRNVIVLRYWCDLSYVEIAAVIGASESAVKSRLHRARVQLGVRMSSAGEAARAVAPPSANAVWAAPG